MIKSILPVFFLGLLMFSSCSSSGSKEESKEDVAGGYATIVVNFGEEELTFDSLSLDSDKSLYDVLVSLDASEAGINVSDTLYEGMGHLIVGFDTVRNEKPYYWIYCLNSKKANKGVDIMELKDGDVVNWYYTDGDTPCNKN
ncbi:DUF4430 domain-containing protein [Marinoscillum sp. MHG1-6]|uniref:DUF4430 domain-containing protein n=1 Tax=Marinoscillum sp. MHG1-6 TaxID=2959627 RepID=UPI0021583198|nr:DUF4430 domain-containing protein [Marinoscillum sp. MHG1-6]